MIKCVTGVNQFQSMTNKNTSLQMETLNNKTKIIKSNDEDTVTKVDHQGYVRKRRCSCLEWTQLIATICIPIIRLATKSLRFFLNCSRTFEKVLEVSILRVYKGSVNIFRTIIKSSICTLTTNRK